MRAHFNVKGVTRTDVLTAIDAYQQRPFEYGKNDCCTFVAFVAEQLTGQDYLQAFDYDDEAQAMEILRRSGGLTGALTGIFGVPVPTSHLDPGDIALITWSLEPNDYVLGVVCGFNQIACVDCNGQIREVPRRMSRQGWRLWRD